MLRYLQAVLFSMSQPVLNLKGFSGWGSDVAKWDRGHFQRGPETEAITGTTLQRDKPAVMVRSSHAFFVMVFTTPPLKFRFSSCIIDWDFAYVINCHIIMAS